MLEDVINNMLIELEKELYNLRDLYNNSPTVEVFEDIYVKICDICDLVWKHLHGYFFDYLEEVSKK